jgi:hypothetical protein
VCVCVCVVWLECATQTSMPHLPSASTSRTLPILQVLACVVVEGQGRGV